MERRAYRVELMMRIFWLALCFCLPALQSAMAGAPDVTVPADTVKCDLKGWSTDRSAQGLSVLAAPNASASVITHYLHGAIANYQVDFSIKGFKDGFLLIKGGVTDDFDEADVGAPVYDGKGWVDAGLVAGGFAGDSPDGLFTAPSVRSAFKPFAKKPDRVWIDKVLSCADDWAEVVTNKGTGWLQGMCNGRTEGCSR